MLKDLRLRVFNVWNREFGISELAKSGILAQEPTVATQDFIIELGV